MTYRPQYGYEHQRAREILLEGDPLCSHCGERTATVADHQPPVALHHHVVGSGCCEYVPSCAECSTKQAHEVRRLVMKHPGSQEVVFAEPDPSPGADSELWRVEWLADLLEVPDDAVWPRWMTAPHPRAVGSLGVEFEAHVRSRTGKELRWWQRLAVRRILEVDADGRFVWLTWLLSVGRQVGKSFLMLELLIFATEHVRRFWHADGVLYASHSLVSAGAVITPALRWADETEGWKARRVNGANSLTLDGELELRVRAVGSAYGTTNGLAVVDEAWNVKRTDIEEGVRPTLLDAEGVLGITSTAHRRATSFMLNERQRCFEQLDTPSTRLMIEWGADRDLSVDDRDGWRQASPYWSPYREERVAEALEAALSGETLDPDEPDPIKSFEAQYLNRWPIRQTRRGAGEPLLEPGSWANALETSAEPETSRVACITDNYGRGSSVAVAGIDADGRIAVSGTMFDSRRDGFEHVATIAGTVDTVLIEATLCHEPDISSIVAITELTGPAELRRGLSGLRELVGDGRLVHDGSPDLASQVLEARLRNGASGLAISSRGRHDTVRAMAHAVNRLQRSISLSGSIEVL